MPYLWMIIVVVWWCMYWIILTYAITVDDIVLVLWYLYRIKVTNAIPMDECYICLVVHV